jgi:hypothetical protein
MWVAFVALVFQLVSLAKPMERPMVHVEVESSTSLCTVNVSNQPSASLTWSNQRAIGVLNGVSPNTPDGRITKLQASTYRFGANEINSIPRLAGLGVQSMQFILGPSIIEEALMANGTSLQQIKEACAKMTNKCPLPGSVGDPDFSLWEKTLTSTLVKIKEMNLSTTTIYDIWNEPNFVGGPGTGGGGWTFPSQWYHPPPQAAPYRGFWNVWNRAVRLIRAIHPGALIVGPSAAPGPGLPEGDPKGWLPQKEWLFLFLKQAHANGTLPDILSWHDYTGQPSMAVSMQEEVRGWMQQQGMQQHSMPMGYNEIVDSVHSQSAGYHIATAEALMRARADHAVFGCWKQPGSFPPVGTCWDGSLDGLLDPTATDAFSPRPKYWALRWFLELPQTLNMAVHIDTTDPSARGNSACKLVGIAAQGSNGSTLLLGRWGVPGMPGPSAFSNLSSLSNETVMVHLPPVLAALTVTIDRLVGCVGLDAPCPAEPPQQERPIQIAARAPKQFQIAMKDGEALRVRWSPG